MKKTFNVIMPKSNNKYHSFDLIEWIKDEQERRRFKIKTKAEFELMLKAMFWSRVQYEFILSPMFGNEEGDKVDIYCLYMEPNLQLLWDICVEEKIIKPRKDDKTEFTYEISKLELGDYTN